MGKLFICFAVVGLLVLVSFDSILAEEASWENIGDGYTNVTAVLVDPRKPQRVYFGSRQGVFSSKDGGRNWERVLSLKTAERQVNALFSKAGENDSLYAATGNGLYFSPDSGASWKKVFQGKNNLEKDCRAVAAFENKIFLGTDSGLFVSNDQGKSWRKQNGELGYSRILNIDLINNEGGGLEIYVACVNGLFRAQNEYQSWDLIFRAITTEKDTESVELDENAEEGENISVVRYVSHQPGDSNCIYLATSSGVYRSRDKGARWEPVPDQGLLKKEVRVIASGFCNKFFASTDNGIFNFEEGYWHDLSVRLVCGKVNTFSADSMGNLYAACDKGLYKFDSSEYNGLKNDRGKTGFSGDFPPISSVQQAAMKYAEVEPEKVRQWRKLAQKKAWLPQMSLGFNRDTADLWHWESGSTAKECDDSLRRGRDSLEWDVRLSWNLGDIVWSEDQTSIDVRSRLTVQLRNEILDEVTKIYFELIRLNSELGALEILDRNKRRDKELRIQELGAYLDAMTGGYFSGRVSDEKS